MARPPHSRSPPLSVRGPIRIQSDPPHTSQQLGPATERSSPESRGDPDTTAARRLHRSPGPVHTPTPTVRARPIRHSCADEPLGPPTSVGSTGQDQLPDGNPRSHVSEAPASHTVQNRLVSITGSTPLTLAECRVKHALASPRGLWRA